MRNPFIIKTGPNEGYTYFRLIKAKAHLRYLRIRYAR
jgi:hypothetical protein